MESIESSQNVTEASNLIDWRHIINEQRGLLELTSLTVFLLLLVIEDIGCSKMKKT